MASRRRRKWRRHDQQKRKYQINGAIKIEIAGSSVAGGVVVLSTCSI